MELQYFSAIENIMCTNDLHGTLVITLMQWI